MDKGSTIGGLDLRTEVGLMEYSEKAIFDIQGILRQKVGDSVAVIKKAMDIEQYLYSEALYKSGVTNVWDSHEAIRVYTDSLDNIKKLLKGKDGDWTKLFQYSDIRSFYTQLLPNRAAPKKRVFYLFFIYFSFNYFLFIYLID